MNYFIRYENLKDDIIKLCTKLGIKDYNINDLPNYRGEFRTNKKHYSKYYDKVTRDIVYKNHKKEFNMFGYKFENE